jgi:hypothetical protein
LRTKNFIGKNSEFSANQFHRNHASVQYSAKKDKKESTTRC